MNGRTNSNGTTTDTIQIPLDPVTNLDAVAGNAQVTLTWTDPLNKYATPEGEQAGDPDQLVSVWSYTAIVRKEGSAPTGIHDGILVAESQVHNQYQTNGYVDSGLTNDTLYYYGLFVVNEDGIESEVTTISAMPKAGTPLSEFAEGTIIKINENGSPVEFYLAKHNYESGLNGDGKELLVRKDCYDSRQWNENNSNVYANSDIDVWYNNTYINLFSEYVKGLLCNTRFYSSKYLSATTEILDRSIFQLSLNELGVTVGSWQGDASKEGTLLPTANILQIATMNGQPSNQQTRSTNYRTSNRFWIVNNEGKSDDWQPINAAPIRPAFTLDKSVEVSHDSLQLIE